MNRGRIDSLNESGSGHRLNHIVGPPPGHPGLSGRGIISALSYSPVDYGRYACSHATVVTLQNSSTCDIAHIFRP